MEIKINKGLHASTDVESLTDHQKVFLAVVSEIYRKLDRETYIFFHVNDLELMTGIRRMDPSTPYARREYAWFHECFKYQFHDHSNLGICIKSPSYRHGWRTLGAPAQPVTITEPGAQRMWLYLMGVFSSGDVTAPFELREPTYHHNAWTLDRDYIGMFNKKFQKKEYPLYDEGPMG